MTYSKDYINEKIIDEKTYIAYRDSENPRKQFVECNGIIMECCLREVWNNDYKLVNLFK